MRLAVEEDRLHCHVSRFTLWPWIRRYNGMPRYVLVMISPDQAELAKLRVLYGNEGEARVSGSSRVSRHLSVKTISSERNEKQLTQNCPGLSLTS